MNTFTIPLRSIANRFSLLTVSVFLLGSCLSIGAAYATQPPKNITTEYKVKSFSQAELEQMLAPIALYPDSLLTHILIAATYPLEVVEAERWAKANQDLSKTDKQKAIDKLDWAPSVKALLAFPMVLTKLSDDLTWTRKIGDAFLQDEEQLLVSIQSLRSKAKIAGNLDDLDNVDVSYEQDAIIIEPAEPKVIYVPYYDTRVVYGDWHWTHYPPVYWPYRHYSYARHHHYNHGHWGWHSGVHISFNFFFSAFHWHKRHLVIDLPSSYSYGRYRHGYKHYKRHHILRSGSAKRWHHNGYHRRGVAYRHPSLHKRYARGKHASSYGKAKYQSAYQRYDVKRHSTESRAASKARYSKVKSDIASAKRKYSDSYKSRSKHVSQRKGVQTKQVKAYQPKRVASRVKHTGQRAAVKQYKSIPSKQYHQEKRVHKSYRSQDRQVRKQANVQRNVSRNYNKQVRSHKRQSTKSYRTSARSQSKQRHQSRSRQRDRR